MKIKARTTARTRRVVTIVLTTLVSTAGFLFGSKLHKLLKSPAGQISANANRACKKKDPNVMRNQIDCKNLFTSLIYHSRVKMEMSITQTINNSPFTINYKKGNFYQWKLSTAKC